MPDKIYGSSSSFATMLQGPLRSYGEIIEAMAGKTPGRKPDPKIRVDTEGEKFRLKVREAIQQAMRMGGGNSHDRRKRRRDIQRQVNHE